MEINEEAVYVNSAVGLASLECPPEIAALIQANGWTIANAPRPLTGEHRWTGPFRAGVFYAAGPPSSWEGAWGWKADNAWPVLFVTNAEILAHIKAECEANEYDLNEALEYSTIAELASQYGLPYIEGAEK